MGFAIPFRFVESLPAPSLEIWKSGKFSHLVLSLAFFMYFLISCFSVENSLFPFPTSIHQASFLDHCLLLKKIRGRPEAAPPRELGSE